VSSPEETSPPERRPRLARLPFLLAALAIGLVLSRRWPSEHAVRVVLGDAAPSVVEVRLRYREAQAEHADEWLREVKLAYTPGHAPRTVSHEPRVPTGDYDLEVEVGTVDAARARRTVTVERKVRLDSATAQVDVASAVRDSLEDSTRTP
jgi:hypothetical protein